MDGYSNQRLALEAVTSCGPARDAARGRESWMLLDSDSAPLPMRRPAQRRNSPVTHCVIAATLLLCLPLGAVAQSSVAPSEVRAPERIGAGMDGQVDQAYECKDQGCERPYKMVNGKPQRLVRTVAFGPNEILEVHEDENGQLEAIKRIKDPGASSAPAAGSAAKEGEVASCGPECHEKNYNAILTLLDALESKQKIEVPKNKLKKVGSFYESRVGVLIHEECFQQYGDAVEKWVTDATVEGLICHGKNEAGFTGMTGQRGQSYSRHIPQLVNLFSPNPNGSFSEGVIYYNSASGNIEVMRDPCRNHDAFGLNLGSRIHQDNCEFDGRFNLTQPKIICQVDRLELAIAESGGNNHYADGKRAAYASNPNHMKPAFINWKDKTEVVNHPIIGMVPRNEKFSEAEFKATYWHELLHNCGNSHDDKGHPDYAYFCATACFGKAYPFSDILIEGAGRQCESSQHSDNTESSLDTIRRVIYNSSGYWVPLKR
jgi:hypothetical protein